MLSATNPTRAERDRDVLLSKLQNVRPSGNDHMASCPLHADSNPSMSISISSDGTKVLVYCFAGCDRDALYTACKDLWGGNGSNGSGNRTNGNGTASPNRKFDFPDGLLQAQQRDLHNAEAAKYLNERGIKLEVAQKLGWGFTKTFFGQERDAMMMPHILDGRLVGVKYKSIAPKEFTQYPGSSIAGLYARGLLDPGAQDVFVFEGPDDVALAMSYGYNATGLIAATSPLDAVDIAMLKLYRRVFLIGDQDKAGREAMDKIAKKLDVRQVIRVQLPVKDIGDLYKQSPESFNATMQQQIRQAQVPAQQIAAPMFDVVEEVEQPLPEYPAPGNDMISEMARALQYGTQLPLGHLREDLKVVFASFIGDGKIIYPVMPNARILGWHFNLGLRQCMKTESLRAAMLCKPVGATDIPKTNEFGVGVHKLTRYGSAAFLVKGFAEQPRQLLYVTEGNVLATANENFPAVFSKLTDAYDDREMSSGSFKNGEHSVQAVEASCIICQTESDFQKTFSGKSALGGGGLQRWTMTHSVPVEKKDWAQDETLIRECYDRAMNRIRDIRVLGIVVVESEEAKAIRLATFGELAALDQNFAARLDDIYRREILLAAAFAPDSPAMKVTVTAEMAEFARKLVEHQYQLREALWPNDAAAPTEQMEIAITRKLKKQCLQSDRELMKAANVHRPGAGGLETYKRAKKALRGQAMKCVGENRRHKALYCHADCDTHPDFGWRWE